MIALSNVIDRTHVNEYTMFKYLRMHKQDVPFPNPLRPNVTLKVLALKTKDRAGPAKPPLRSPLARASTGYASPYLGR